MTTSLPEFIAQGVLPISTTVPEQEEQFVPYLTRLYEQISQAVNAKDANFYVIPVTSVATNIPNVANFGSFLISVGGSAQYSDGGYLPSLVVAVTKSSPTAAASATAVLNSQAGTGTAWGGVTLTISSTATNFQIAHSGAATLTGNFNIRTVGTQSL